MFESEIISALDQVEQAADSLWTLIDNVSFAGYENAHDDVASHLKAMRGSYALSLQVLHRLQEFQRTVCDGIEQFSQKMGRFENYISRTALNLLPDEILSEIFVLAATRLDVDEKAALSLVCKRFRRVMMSMRKMWDGYWMEVNQPPEQIISIAEGNNFVSLKARICWSSPHDFVRTRVTDRGLDLDEYAMRYCKFSVGLILSFRPEELEIGWSRAAWALEAIEPILADGNPQNLRGQICSSAPRFLLGVVLQAYRSSRPVRVPRASTETHPLYALSGNLSEVHARLHRLPEGRRVRRGKACRGWRDGTFEVDDVMSARVID